MVNWLMHVCTFVLFSIGYLGPSSSPPAPPPYSRKSFRPKKLSGIGWYPLLNGKVLFEEFPQFCQDFSMWTIFGVIGAKSDLYIKWWGRVHSPLPRWPQIKASYSSGVRYPGFLIEWIFYWIESSQIKIFESFFELNILRKRIIE